MWKDLIVLWSTTIFTFLSRFCLSIKSKEERNYRILHFGASYLLHIHVLLNKSLFVFGGFLDFFRFTLIANIIGGMMLSVLTFGVRISGKLYVIRHLKGQLTTIFLV
jgi:hypothetical protein